MTKNSSGLATLIERINDDITTQDTSVRLKALCIAPGLLQVLRPFDWCCQLMLYVGSDLLLSGQKSDDLLKVQNGCVPPVYFGKIEWFNLRPHNLFVHLIDPNVTTAEI